MPGSPQRAFAAIALLAVVFAAFGCGGGNDDAPPERLDAKRSVALERTVERIDDAIDTEETMRTSRSEADRLRTRVQRLVSRGAFENARLDEFGLASLGQRGGPFRRRGGA